MGQNCWFGNCEAVGLPEAHSGSGKGCQAGTENIDGACLIRCKWGRNLDRIYSIMERLNVKRFDQITSSTYHIYGWLFDHMLMGTRANLAGYQFFIPVELDQYYCRKQTQPCNL